MALALTLNLEGNILQKFHRTLLPRMKINCNILIPLISPPFYIDSFQIKILEDEQTIESINMVISYFVSKLLTRDLLI